MRNETPPPRLTLCAAEAEIAGHGFPLVQSPLSGGAEFLGRYAQVSVIPPYKFGSRADAPSNVFRCYMTGAAELMVLGLVPAGGGSPGACRGGSASGGPCGCRTGA